MGKVVYSTDDITHNTSKEDFPTYIVTVAPSLVDPDASPAKKKTQEKEQADATETFILDLADITRDALLLLLNGETEEMSALIRPTGPATGPQRVRNGEAKKMREWAQKATDNEGNLLWPDLSSHGRIPDDAKAAYAAHIAEEQEKKEKENAQGTAADASGGRA